MPQYKRVYEGRTFFFTVVAHKRQPFLCGEQPRHFLRESIQEARTKLPFKIDAWVLLPDHLHCIWTLPAGDADYSTRWGRIKAGFSKKMKMAAGDLVGWALPTVNAFRTDKVGWAPATMNGIYTDRSPSRERHRESVYWQRRFWEHAIRNQADYNAHMDYVHFNPVKHGFAAAPAGWDYSSFHRLVKEGVYERDWGSTGDMAFEIAGGE